MLRSAANSTVVRFGMYQADFRAGELFKNGCKIRLQEQPFQVLSLLLERPGEVVTREELRKQLWSDDTFVDFDLGLNKAINKVREALSDSAENPRFVETLPRRGYRFLAPVEGVMAPGLSDVAPGHAVPPARPHPRMLRRFVWTSGVFAAIAALAGAGGLFRSDPPVAPPRLRAVPLTTYPGFEQHPTFSPDGTQVAFSWNGQSPDNYDLYVQAIASQTPLQLTSDSAWELSPAWSPDGRQIAFIRSSEGNSAVWVIPPLGGPERKIADLTRSELSLLGSSLAWTRDSKSLFVRARSLPADPGRIYQLSVDTSQRRPVTSAPSDTPVDDFHPAVSADAQTLAFVRGSPPFSNKGEIHVLPLAGGVPRPVTAMGGLIEGMCWRPDGRDIVFSWSASWRGESSLWRVSVPGGEPQQLAGIGEDAWHPVISAQASRLVYTRRVSAANIWRYPLSRSGVLSGLPEKLIASTRDDVDGHISPDGKRIVFTSSRSGDREIWVCDRDGSSPTQLTFLRSLITGSPRWSPDGKQIAFDAAPREKSDIFVIDAEGGVPRGLVTRPSNDQRPSWSHDGAWVYFASWDEVSEFPQIWKVPAAGGEPVQVTKRGGYQPFESPDGRFVYYGNHAGPGVWRVLVAGGEEEVALPFLGPTSFYARWAVGPDGLYFIELQKDPASGGERWLLKMSPFDSGEVIQLLDLGQKPAEEGTPLAIAPDGSWLLYTQADHEGSDLMLVEDFR